MARKNSHSVDKWQEEKDEILEFMPSLRAFAISLSRDETRAEDLVQETYLRAISNLDMFEKGTNLHGWLFTILRNVFNSNYRKSKREVEWDPFFENSLAVSTGLGIMTIEATNELDHVLLCMACLPPEQSDAIVAIGYLGLSYDDAAERLGCEVGTIKSRVNRARNILAELLEDGRPVQVDVSRLKTAMRSVPKSHKFYPIAQAYEELFRDVRNVGVATTSAVRKRSQTPLSDKLWEDLVASGALDDNHDDLPNFMELGREEL